MFRWICFPIMVGMLFLVSGTISAASSDGNITTEHQELLEKLRGDTIAMDKMVDACVLTGEGKRVDAVEIIKKIDLNNTSLKISKYGVNYEGVIDFFLRYPKLDKSSCVTYSRLLFQDSSQ